MKARVAMVVAGAGSTIGGVSCAVLIDIAGDYQPAAGTTDASSASDGGDGGAAGCTADLASDPNNCGACGRSCAGTACSAGRCAVVDVAVGLDATSIAVDDTSIYWADPGDGGLGAGSVFKCNKDGPCNGTALASVTRPVALDTTSASVFVLASKDLAGGVQPRAYRIAKEGGAPAECGKNGGPLTQSSVAPASDGIFVAQSDGLYHCLDTCAPGAGTECVKVLGEKTANVIAQSGDHLFWMGVDADRAGLRTCALGGSMCTADPLTNMTITPTEVRTLAADDAHVFAASMGQISALARTSSDSREVAPVGARAGVRLLADANTLYTTTASAIVRVPKTGGAPLTVAEVDTTAVTMDEKFIYFVDGARRALARVAK